LLEVADPDQLGTIVDEEMRPKRWRVYYRKHVKNKNVELALKE